ncbi:MAG TPA: hypothetical protein VL947_04570 [Cytophagales bacterium]|nr:hypothetical protein [Cytophagales bacterium]
MKNTTTLLLLGVSLLQAQSLHFFKTASVYSKGICKLKVSPENEIVCLGGTNEGKPTTYLFNTAGKTQVSTTPERIYNISFGPDKAALLSTPSGDYYTEDFKAFLKGKKSPTPLSGLRTSKDSALSSTEYAVGKGHLYAFTPSIQNADGNNTITRRGFTNPESKKAVFPESKYGIMRALLFKASTEYLYAYFDHTILILDLNMNVVEKNKTTKAFPYRILRVFDGSNLMGIKGDTLKVLNFNLESQGSYAIKEIYEDLVVDGKGNVYVMKRNHEGCDIYKVVLHDGTLVETNPKTKRGRRRNNLNWYGNYHHNGAGWFHWPVYIY